MDVDRQRFYTGIPLIDNQHDAYLDLVDTLFSLCGKPNVDKVTIDDSVAKVFAYAIEHFDAEEALMRSVRYPGLEAHRAKHDEFRKEVDKLSESGYSEMGLDRQLIYLTKWLLEWFCDQTQTADRTYKLHFPAGARYGGVG